MPSYDNAKDFRERVRFERRRESGDDGYGNMQYEWQTIAGPAAARIKPARGTEEVFAQRLAGTNVYEITVRSHQTIAAIDAGDRCINERSAAIYNITAVVNTDERRRYLTMTAQSGVAT